jgi:hypothetical protein
MSEGVQKRTRSDDHAVSARPRYADTGPGALQVRSVPTGHIAHAIRNAVGSDRGPGAIDLVMRIATLIRPRCPRWIRRGPGERPDRCHPRTDVARRHRHVRFAPGADIGCLPRRQFSFRPLEFDNIRTSILRYCPDIRLLVAPNKISPGLTVPGLSITLGKKDGFDPERLVPGGDRSLACVKQIIDTDLEDTLCFFDVDRKQAARWIADEAVRAAAEVVKVVLDEAGDPVGEGVFSTDADRPTAVGNGCSLACTSASVGWPRTRQQIDGQCD